MCCDDDEHDDDDDGNVFKLIKLLPTCTEISPKQTQKHRIRSSESINLNFRGHIIETYQNVKAHLSFPFSRLQSPYCAQPVRDQKFCNENKLIV